MLFAYPFATFSLQNMFNPEYFNFLRLQPLKACQNIKIKQIKDLSYQESYRCTFPVIKLSGYDTGSASCKAYAQ